SPWVRPIKSLRPNWGCHSAPSRPIGLAVFRSSGCAMPSNWPGASWPCRNFAVSAACLFAAWGLGGVEFVDTVDVRLARQMIVEHGLMVIDRIDAQHIVIHEGQAGSR